VLAATPGCCGGEGTVDGMWRWCLPREPEGSAFAPIPQPADAAGPDVPRGRLENPKKFPPDSTESRAEEDEFPLSGGEMGARTDGEGFGTAGGESGMGGDWIFYLEIRCTMDEWMAGWASSSLWLYISHNEHFF
jgi:hypothetical protein